PRSGRAACFEGISHHGGMPSRRLGLVIVAAALFGLVVIGSVGGMSIADAAGSVQPAWWAERAPRPPGDSATLDAAAHALGISTDELQTDLKSGKTIAQIASEKNVDLNTVIDAMVNAAQAELRQHITDFANNGRQHGKDLGPGGPGAGPHGHGAPGMPSG